MRVYNILYVAVITLGKLLCFFQTNINGRLTRLQFLWLPARSTPSPH